MSPANDNRKHRYHILADAIFARSGTKMPAIFKKKFRAILCARSAHEAQKTSIMFEISELAHYACIKARRDDMRVVS